MKNKKNKTFFFATLILFMAFFIIGLIFWNNYSSKVILAKPFSISIEGLSKFQTENVRVFGHSPFNKLQVILRNEKNNNWEYLDYSSFKDLFIVLPDSARNIKYILLKSGDKQKLISPISNRKTSNEIELTHKLKGFTSKCDIF